MRKVNVLSLAVVGLTAAITAPMVRTASAVTAEPKAIKFGTSLPDALKLAAKTHKPILIDFGAEWCGPCKKMLKETYTDPSIVSRAEGFIPVYVDIDKQPKIAEKYNIPAVPTVIFLNSKGKEIGRNQGFKDAAKFGPIMDEAKKKA